MFYKVLGYTVGGLMIGAGLGSIINTYETCKLLDGASADVASLAQRCAELEAMVEEDNPDEEEIATI